MSDYQLRLDRTPPGPTLGDFRLRLDPALDAQMRALEAVTLAGRLQRLCLTPDWTHFDPGPLARLWTAPQPHPRSPFVPRGAGPATPRPGKVGDVLAGLWAIPAVQSAANRVVDDLRGRFIRDWRTLSTAERVAAVSHTAVLAAAALAAVYNDAEAREILARIEDTDLPVPGVDGLTFRLAPRGGGVGFAPAALPGLSGRASVRVRDTSSPRAVHYSVTVTFDIAEWLRRR